MGHPLADPLGIFELEDEGRRNGHCGLLVGMKGKLVSLADRSPLIGSKIIHGDAAQQQVLHGIDTEFENAGSHLHRERGNDPEAGVRADQRGVALCDGDIQIGIAPLVDPLLSHQTHGDPPAVHFGSPLHERILG